jgi:cytochrome c-type biogenesis protein CcsB
MDLLKKFKKILLPLSTKYLTPFFNTKAAGFYIMLFAASIAIATFIENDYGTSSAQKLIFKSWWFELLLLLFGITIIVNVFKFRMIQQRKWALVIFHLAIVIILIGSGLTRYFGSEGIMHIRENESTNRYLSFNPFLEFKVHKDGEKFDFNEPTLFASLGNNNWHESYLIDDDLVDVKVKAFIPNVKQMLVSTNSGLPTLKIVVSGMNGREEYFISQGQTKRIRNVLYNFKNNELTDAINIVYSKDSLRFKTNKPLTQMVMATQKKDTILPTDTYSLLKLRSLYSDGTNNFVVSEFNEKAEIILESETVKVKNKSVNALIMDISVNGTTQETIVYGSRGIVGRPQMLTFDGIDIAVSYGSKNIYLPFFIKLKKFILDKYPGTNSASSYASEVVLLDERNNTNIDFKIFMNNILNYEGYRFFQSSFDKDEKGTYLSVNNDYWGTLISYIGYALLTIGLIMVFFSKNTRFYQVLQKIKKIRAKSGTFIWLFLLSFSSTSFFAQAQENTPYLKYTVNTAHADAFSKLVVQDHKGRMKPVYTLSREIMRKLYRKENFEGLNADQVILSMFVNKKEWTFAEIIKLGKHNDILKQLNLSGKYASYNDFFNEKGVYKLRDEVRRVYDLNPKDRGIYEKELLKIDERLNILSMVFSGNLLKMIPVANDINNTWVSRQNYGKNSQENRFATRFFNAYETALKKAITTGNYTKADKLLNELRTYQIKIGSSVLPSKSKINAEIFLNKFNIFNRLAGFYFFLGLAFLFFLFMSVFKPNIKLKLIYKVLFTLVVIGFICHSLGLGLRWYVSGRAPWSNGYESMIYIAWTTTLAGVIFTRRSFGGLAATMILASTILMVSMLSFLDPEITPLVPVLKSYWLTIHVSLEAGSYGFLMLGAIIGLINLILMIFVTNTNKDRVKRIITEMSYISELTIFGGLVMVSVGTYLGGVWANESWGRYWGWDAKETWALVTILVYAFILHMRIIPKLTGLFIYNVSTIFGLATVIMTYYGVNYYLSGLHSYATGDPVPIPKWVYITVGCIIIISVLAYLKKKKYKFIT